MSDITVTDTTLDLRPNGNIIGFIGERYRCVSTKHPNYAQLRKAYDEKNIDEFVRIYNENILDFTSTEKYEIQDALEVRNESIEYRGRTITDPDLVTVIKNYGTKCDALKRFVDNMFLNPKWESVEQLARFLKHNNFPLTEDGCFLGYKAVTKDFRDKHTGTINNSVGSLVTMPRNNVTFDPKSSCSAGLHVGTYSYATGFGGGDDVMVIVKVNPAHVVSVPFDCSGEKLRTSQYQVVAICSESLDINKIFTIDGRELTAANYFSDLRENEFRRMRRSSVTCTVSVTDCDDDDDEEYDEDYTDRYYYCDNCGWQEPVDDIVDSIGKIGFCPQCGNEISVIEE